MQGVGILGDLLKAPAHGILSCGGRLIYRIS